jgi:hypothetical protein
MIASKIPPFFREEPSRCIPDFPRRKGPAMKSSPLVPRKYFDTASETSLASFELAQRARAQNVRKEIGELLDECIRLTAEAETARWVREAKRP